MNWAKVKKLNATQALADESDWTDRDAAARWIRQHEEKKNAKREKKIRPQTRREDLKSGPPDNRPGIVVYTDGACEPNPGRGGWGFVVYDEGVEIYAAFGGSLESTNNIMELTGLKMALEWVRDRGVAANVISDSQYVVKGSNEWRFGWKARGWRRVLNRKSGKTEPVKNADLWREIDELLQSVSVKISWCKGHAGILGNERADELSNVGRRHAIDESRRSAQAVSADLDVQISEAES
jgi:ribonuclease HI